ncbi:DUF4381 domain-containing protein [Rubritalea sp.]|uniref:DUF4381 domain-containing protein n=1 Tax=Rubritalea sp. TaxID=2109375 RepID=UPI003EF7608D
MENLSLNDLRDFSEPLSPSWWPLAPGLVFALLLSAWVILCLGWWWLQKRKASAYRRAGLALLEEATTLRDLSVVLKRVAMVSFGREQVASLYGAEWVSYLEASCSGVSLEPLTDASAQAVSADVRKQASKWIKEHQC